MERIYDYTIKLIRYVLNGDIPELPEEIDFEQLFAFGRSHGVENMLYVGLRDLKISVPAETMKKFQTAYEMQIMVEATQALELEIIGEAFENAGIDYIPLKGSVIKYLYPMPDYRKSGDIDILIRPADRQNVNSLLKENGYIVDEFDIFEIHDGYRKPPYILVEIHNRLLEKNNRAYGFFSTIWEKVQLKEGTNHCYEMNDEVLYAFIIAHLCKHIKNNGAGIKFICDIWVLNKAHSINRDYIKMNRILRMAHIEKFEEMARNLSESWFGNSESNDDPLEKFIFESGSFGNKYQRNKLIGSVATESSVKMIRYKIKKLFRNVFPPYNSMRREYPILIRYRLLLPVIWVVRIFKLVFKDERKVSDMLEQSLSINKEESNKLRVLWNAVS